MKQSTYYILFVLFYFSGFGQKPAIDTSAIFNWKHVQDPLLSADGNYFAYTIFNLPRNSQTLVIRSTLGDRHMFIQGGRRIQFSADGEFAAFKKDGDSLGIVSLEGMQVDYIPAVTAFQFIFLNDKTSIVFQRKDKPVITVKKLVTNLTKEFNGTGFWVHPRSGFLIVKQKNQSVDHLEKLSCINLHNGQSQKFWEGSGTNYLVWNSDGTRLTYSEEGRSSSAPERVFWFYQAGNESAVRLPSPGSDSTIKDLEFVNFPRFSNDGNSLFVSLRKRENSPNTAGVDIWTYQDAMLQSQQLQFLSREQKYRSLEGVIIIPSKKLFVLAKDNYLPSAGQNSENWMVYSVSNGDSHERNWNVKARSEYVLISKQDGSSIKLPIPKAALIMVSPMDKYVLYYHPDQKKYFTYEISSGKTKCITRDLKVDWTINDDRPESEDMLEGIAGWAPNDSAVFIYDQFDIWKVSLNAKMPPVNVTNGYGYSNKIIFRFGLNYNNDVLPGSEKIILSAFNTSTKENGFFSSNLNSKENPTLLSMAPFCYYAPEARTVDIDNTHNFIPLKATEANKFIVQRMKADQSPNYFCTEDFRTFTALSDVYPEKKYNWMKTELVHFKLQDGPSLDGVLYKPDNFDSTKKYPIIFYYYERVSDGIHVFYPPHLADGCLNIPWFVSNGYLIFTPDIHYTIGHTGQSALDAIVTAANHLATFPFIDRKKMGLQGHSFGGFETNYVISHSNLFACAMSSSGLSDFISGYLSVRGWGAGNTSLFERQQNRIGGTLWQKISLYMRNSPVLFADKISTPVLLLHNIKDGNAPFLHGLELFTALRRLGKRAWMLQYDNFTHGLDLYDTVATLDYTIRITQFFDHYLKDSACPRWMLYGIPAKDKGIDNGYELVREKDKNGKWLSPQEGGLLTDEEKKKVEALKHRKPVTVRIE
jgi:dipeptidyl aminopeptidase/acylaminoacyl peptidase